MQDGPAYNQCFLLYSLRMAFLALKNWGHFGPNKTWTMGRGGENYW